MAFEKLRKSEKVQEEGDVIYSSTFETGVYPFQIDMAYIDESDGGAAFMSLSLIADDGRTLKQNIYFTSGDAKGNAITYEVKKNGSPTGEQKYLPGFTLCSDLHEILTDGVELADMETEGKLVKVYDKDAGSEQPAEKQVLVNLLGQTVKLAVQKQAMFKQVNKDGTYVNTDEIINRNEIVKVFDAETNQTVSEIKAEADATYMDKWLTSYKDKVFDKTKAKGGGSAAPENKPAQKKKKLFS